MFIFIFYFFFLQQKALQKLSRYSFKTFEMRKSKSAIYHHKMENLLTEIAEKKYHEDLWVRTL